GVSLRVRWQIDDCGSRIVLEPSEGSALFVGAFNVALLRFDRTTLEQTVLARSAVLGPIALAPNGARVFAAAQGFVGTLSRIDLSTGTIEPIARGPQASAGIALNRSGTTAYLTAALAGFIESIEVATGTVTFIETTASGLLG